MTTPAALTPYSWPVKELTEARVAFICALVGNFGRMQEHLKNLPREALVDLRYALDVMHPTVTMVAGPEPMPLYEPRILHESIRLPCGRCGHEERQHGRGDHDVRLCLDCDMVCQPVVAKAAVPAHVEGYAIEGRTK